MGAGLKRAKKAAEATRFFPTIANGEDDRTTEAWVVFRTGPHVPWHIGNMYTTERGARAALAKYQGDMYTDGVVIRKITLAPAVERWERR
jgi:hypothetical protein